MSLKTSQEFAASTGRCFDSRTHRILAREEDYPPASQHQTLPAYARLNFSMSIFFIWRIACITLWDFSISGSLIISIKTLGTICQDTPNLSLSQLHICAFSSPPLESSPQ